MNKTLIWTLVGTGILFLILLILLLLPGSWGYGGMMGGYGMMGGRYGFMNPLGWLGMAFMWLGPAAHPGHPGGWRCGSVQQPDPAC